VLEAAGRIPVVGEVFTVQHCLIEVVDLDGRRIDKVLASRRTA
jgi:CBS domain containing-hemolysin-like protein